MRAHFGRESRDSPGAKPRTSSKLSWTRTPRKTLRTAPTKRGGRAAQGPSSEALAAFRTAVGHKPAEGWTRNSGRNLEQAGHSRIDLIFFLLFVEISLPGPLARLPPPPARGCSVRRPGEEVDERVCGIPSDFLSPLDGLRCLILARQIPRPSSIFYKAAN